jgi:hypothetical protein
MTQATHLQQLVSAGWDLHALVAREKQTSAGIALAQFAAKLARKASSKAA